MSLFNYPNDLMHTLLFKGAFPCDLFLNVNAFFKEEKTSKKIWSMQDQNRKSKRYCH